MKQYESKEQGISMLLVMFILGPLLTIGILSLNMSVEKQQQITNSRLKRVSLHLADAGLNEGAALLKLDENDGFQDEELTAAYPVETMTVNSTSYDIHRWINTITVSDKRKFKVWLADNDDAGYVTGPSNDTIVGNDFDEDLGVILISRGWIEDGAGNPRSISTIKGLYKKVSYEPKYAILSGGDITLQGSISVTGSQPSIHTNSNLTSIGNADITEGAVTASQTVAGEVNLVGGGTTGISNAQVQDIPPVSAEYYRSIASNLVIDILNIMTVTKRPPGGAGDLYESMDGTECLFLFRAPPDAATTVNIEYIGGCPGSAAIQPLKGVVYIDGNVTVSVDQPWNGVVLASGSIEFYTNTNIQGHIDLEGVAAVANAEIYFRGNIQIGSPTNQLGVYTATYFDFGGGGNKTLYGPIIATDGFSLSPLAGNISIVYDNNNPPKYGPLTGKLLSWTQIE